jgi:hypothetical protein
MQMVSVESRLEPYWVVTVATRTVYDRQAAYTIPIKGEEVREVTVLGQKLIVGSKGGPSLTLNGVEHCVGEQHVTRFFDGLSGQKTDLSRYQSFAKTEISDLTSFAPDGTLVVPPEMRATAIVRQVLGEVIQPVSGAQVIHEERVDVEAIELNFRPVYALEYEWANKGNRVVIESTPCWAIPHRRQEMERSDQGHPDPRSVLRCDRRRHRNGRPRREYRGKTGQGRGGPRQEIMEIH